MWVKDAVKSNIKAMAIFRLEESQRKEDVTVFSRNHSCLFLQWSSVCGSPECGNNDHQEKGELDWEELLNALRDEEAAEDPHSSCIYV